MSSFVGVVVKCASCLLTATFLWAWCMTTISILWLSYSKEALPSDMFFQESSLCQTCESTSRAQLTWSSEYFRNREVKSRLFSSQNSQHESISKQSIVFTVLNVTRLQRNDEWSQRQETYKWKKTHACNTVYTFQNRSNNFCWYTCIESLRSSLFEVSQMWKLQE